MHSLTVHKWKRKGLESILFGGIRYTTEQALREYIEKQNPNTSQPAATLRLADGQFTTENKGIEKNET